MNWLYGFLAVSNVAVAAFNLVRAKKESRHWLRVCMYFSFILSTSAATLMTYAFLFRR